MISDKLLTQDLISDILDGEEIPLRCKSFDPQTVNEVFRYGAIIGNTLEQHARITRGMDRARQLIRQAETANRSFASGTVILADEMTGSKGRFKRSWHAPRGGLWMTIVVVNTLLPESSLLIPLAAGIACCEVIRDFGITAHLRWVNDVLVKSRKISGILTETFTGPRFGEEYIMIGIGININNDRFPPELSGRAISLKSCLNRETGMADLAARLLVKLRWNIGLLYYEEARHLEIHGGIACRNENRMKNLSTKSHLLLERYKILTDVFNRKVIFGFDVQESPLFTAKVAGLDHSGGLILELDDGSRTVQYSGEISYLD